MANTKKSIKLVKNPLGTKTVKEFIQKARAAGHDSLGIANDQEFLAISNKMRETKELTAKQDKQIVLLNRKNNRIAAVNREISLITRGKRDIYKVFGMLTLLIMSLGGLWPFLPWWISWTSALLIGTVGVESYKALTSLREEEDASQRKLLRVQDDAERIKLLIAEDVEI